MARDPKDVYREAVERLLGPSADDSIAGRIRHFAAGEGIARGDLLRRLKVDSDTLDHWLGVLLIDGTITLKAERTGGRPRIIVVATGK